MAVQQYLISTRIRGDPIAGFRQTHAHTDAREQHLQGLTLKENSICRMPIRV